MKTITVDIFPDGTSKIDAKGFTGKTCSLATRDIELALVGSDDAAIDKKPKPDFYATLGQSQTIKG